MLEPPGGLTPSGTESRDGLRDPVSEPWCSRFPRRCGVCSSGSVGCWVIQHDFRLTRPRVSIKARHPGPVRD